MEKLTLKEIQALELGVLRQVDELCRREKLRYCLCGGTLLGALRHGGFIPWDDDIDIAMPRPDYERFVALCQREGLPFRLCCHETEPDYGYLFAKVWDPATRVVDVVGSRTAVDIGVGIDIFPMDGLGNSRAEALKNFRKTSFLRELLVAANWKGYSRSKTRAWYYEPIRLTFFLLSRLVKPSALVERLQKTLRGICFDEADYVAIVMGVYRERDIIEKRLLEEAEMEFEGERFVVPAGYATWLGQIYGDYMTPPPPEKQVTHHSFDAYYRAAEQK